MVVNNSNIKGGDIAGEDFSLPTGTTDEQGAAACTKFCDGLAACTGWVFVRASKPEGKGPRCAIKGKAACANAADDKCGGCESNGVCYCVSGTKPSTAYKPCGGGGGGGGGQGFAVPYAHDESFDGRFALRVLVDRPVIEVYAQNGQCSVQACAATGERAR